MNTRKSALPPREQFSLGVPLYLVAICLDTLSQQGLEGFAKSTPLVRLQPAVNGYLSEQDDAQQQWMQENMLDICLIDFDRDRRRAAVTSEKVHAALPNATIFAVSDDSQPELIIQAMRSGCSEYLLKPVAQEQLLQAIARVASRKKENQPIGQVLTFIGSKGGVGVTTTAAHLSTLLSRSHSRRSLLVDLHPLFGDAELYLGMTKYQYSFRELLENTHRLDADLLQSFVLHHNSGLDFLAAPGTLRPAKAVKPEAVSATIDFLRSQYDFVLVDCPPGLSDDNLEAIQRSDQVYVITVPEVAAVRDAARYLEYFAKINFPREKLRVVLNRCSKRDSISDEQIEEAIHAKIFRKLPNQYFEVIKSINGGDPSSGSSSSELARNLNEWASSLASEAGPRTRIAAKKSSKGLLAFLGT